MRNRGRSFVLFLLVLIACRPAAARPAQQETVPGPGLWAIELGVPDLERSVGFYTGALGFHLEHRDAARAELRNGEGRLILAPTTAPAAPDTMARVYLNMSVGDLDRAAETALRMGGRLDSPRPVTSAVGPYLVIRDPAGHPVHLIDHPWDEMTAEEPPAVFNYGMNVPSVEQDEAFLTRLGFEVSTRDYLPDTLVFKRQGIGYVVMHPHAETAWDPGWSSGALVLAGAIPGGAPETRGPSGILFKTKAGD